MVRDDDEVSNISEDSFIDDQEVGLMLSFIDNLQMLKMNCITEVHNEALEDIEQLMKF